MRDKTLAVEAMEIDISSPIFKGMLNDDLNMEIKRVIEKVYVEEFSAGEIAVKLKLSLSPDHKEYPTEDMFGEIIYDSYEYRRPSFDHTVTSTLKKQYKQEGFYTEEKEVICDNGKYLIIPLREPQISLFEENEDEV